MKELRQEKEENKSEREEKEDEPKPIDWDSSRLYIPLQSAGDCGTEPTVRATPGITPWLVQITRHCTSN